MYYWENEKVRLDAFEKGDIELFKKCLSLYEMQEGNCDFRFPVSDAYCKKKIEEMSDRENDETEGQFLKVMDKMGDCVGVIDIHNIDERVGYFEYGIAIFPEHRRKGYAKNAISLIIKYFFEERRYQKVNAMIYSFNDASIALHEKLGFMLEGKIRRNFYTRGSYFDTLIYGMTVEELRD